jgi:hypothetical protein
MASTISFLHPGLTGLTYGMCLHLTIAAWLLLSAMHSLGTAYSVMMSTNASGRNSDMYTRWTSQVANTTHWYQVDVLRHSASSRLGRAEFQEVRNCPGCCNNPNATSLVRRARWIISLSSRRRTTSFQRVILRLYPTPGKVKPISWPIVDASMSRTNWPIVNAAACHRLYRKSVSASTLDDCQGWLTLLAGIFVAQGTAAS